MWKAVRSPLCQESHDAAFEQMHWSALGQALAVAWEGYCSSVVQVYWKL